MNLKYQYSLIFLLAIFSFAANAKTCVVVSNLGGIETRRLCSDDPNSSQILNRISSRSSCVQRFLDSARESEILLSNANNRYAEALGLSEGRRQSVIDRDKNQNRNDVTVTLYVQYNPQTRTFSQNGNSRYFDVAKGDNYKHGEIAIERPVIYESLGRPIIYRGQNCQLSEVRSEALRTINKEERVFRSRAVRHSTTGADRLETTTGTVQ